VVRLRDALLAVGFNVWWDADIPPGQNWRREIKRALKGAPALVACFSDNTARRYTSGIFPELRDAIGIYRERAPGQGFLFPVRFDACAIPEMEIDATTELADLQYTDLFPDDAWSAGIDRLQQALMATPGPPLRPHP
jgi:hypothetical protein